jgi:triacylglycerol lipase
VQTNVCFTEHGDERLLCDVYLPAESSAEREGRRHPAVVVVHGGAWVGGDKWAIGVFARRLADAGFVAVSINYRLAPRHKFPAQVDDVRSALVWLVESADEYGVDPQRIGMLGYSAGAHLSCMIGTLVDAEWEQIAPTTVWDRDDPRWAKLPKVTSVVGGGTPCDFTGLPTDNESLAYFLGGSRRQVPEAYRAASPVSHASPGDAAMLLIHGTRDLLVPIASSRKLYDLHQRLGIASQFVALEGFGHMLTFLHPQTRERAVQFLTEHLQGEPEPNGPRPRD